MNLELLIVIGVISGALLALVLDQVHRDRLYVGYAVAIMVAVFAILIAAAVLVVFPALTQTIRAVLPKAALTLLGVSLILFVLLYVLTQVTLVANRVAAVVQEMAIRTAGEERQEPTGAGEGRSRRAEPEKEPS